MSTTFTRVASVQVTNIQAANTGNSVTTAANGDVILFDRTFAEVSDTATVQTAADVETLYVGLGVSAGGAIESSMPIQVRNIRNVKVTPYVAATPYSVTLGNITAANSTEYIVKIIYRDQFSSAPAHSAPRSYVYASDAAATPAEIATGLAAAINADKNSQVTASVSTNDLVITGKIIAPNAIDTYQRVTFDVATPLGFAATTTRTVNPGSDGSGIGQKVKDLEQSTKSAQRILFPIPTETTKASVSGIYNLVTIEHYNEHIGDLANQRKEPLKTVIAFASTSATPSAKQAAFMVKLASVVESAGIYVS
jgi:hypothetical protein